MLNPVFSTKHLREMTPIFYEVVHKACLILVCTNIQFMRPANVPICSDARCSCTARQGWR